MVANWVFFSRSRQTHDTQNADSKLQVRMQMSCSLADKRFREQDRIAFLKAVQHVGEHPDQRSACGPQSLDFSSSVWHAVQFLFITPSPISLLSRL